MQNRCGECMYFGKCNHNVNSGNFACADFDWDNTSKEKDLYKALEKSEKKVLKIRKALNKSYNEVSNIKNKIFDRIINDNNLNANDLNYILSNSSAIELDINILNNCSPSFHIGDITGINYIEVVDNKFKINIKKIVSFNFDLKDAEIIVTNWTINPQFTNKKEYNIELTILLPNVIINIKSESMI